MAQSSSAGNQRKYVLANVDSNVDSIQGLEEKCNVRPYGDISELINAIGKPNPKREFGVDDKGEDVSKDQLSRYNVTSTLKYLPGQFVGVVRGKVTYKETEKKKAPFPVFDARVRAKPDDGAVVEMHEDTPTLEMKEKARLTRQTQDVTHITILVEDNDNPLGKAPFHSMKKKDYNAKAVFVPFLDKILLCVVATKEIAQHQPIVVYSTDVSLYETWPDYHKRMIRKRKGSASSAGSSTESVGSGRSKKKRDELEEEEGIQLVAKKSKSNEEIPVAGSSKQANDSAPSTSGQSNDEVANPAIKNAAKLLLKQKTMVTRTTSVPQSILRSKQKNAVDEAIQGVDTDAAPVEDSRKLAIPVRVTRSRQKVNVENEPPVEAAQAGNKRQVQKTLSAPPDTAQGSQGEQAPSLPVDVNISQKAKLRRTPSNKTKANPTPVQAVNNQINISTPPNVKLHPKTFEDPKDFKLHHLGIIFHQSSPMKNISEDIKKNFKTIIEQEESRRKKHSSEATYVEYAKNQLMKVCKCVQVDQGVNLTFKQIKQKIKDKISECKNDKKLVNESNGVRLFIVFTTPLVVGTRLYFTAGNDSADLFKNIILPLFEVKDHKPQRIYPFIILDSSLGKEVTKLEADFELIRWSPTAPNECSLEHCAGLGAIDIIKEFNKAYKDEKVQQVDFVHILQKTNCSHYQGYLTSDDFLINHKLSLEHHTSEPFIVRRPVDIRNELQVEEMKGYFYLVQHCSQGERKASFRVMNNIMLELCRYLNVRRVFLSTDWFDSDDKDFKAEIIKVKAKHKQEFDQNIKPKLIKKLGTDLKLTVKTAEAEKIAEKVPGLQSPTIHTLPIDFKTKVVKERMKEFFGDIKKVSRYAVRKGKPYLVLGHHCRGGYDGFVLADLTREDLLAKPLLLIPYAKVYEKVIKYGIKKVIIFSLHFDSEHPNEECMEKYKTEYPRITRGGTPSTQNLPVEHVRIESNMPQYTLLTACLQGSQLPNPANKFEFSPMFPTLEKVYNQWAKADPISPHAIVRQANKIGSKVLYDRTTISGPESQNLNVKTKCCFVINSNMIFEDEWKLD